MNAQDTILRHLAAAATALEHCPHPNTADFKDARDSAKKATKLLEASVAMLEEGIREVCDPFPEGEGFFGPDGQPAPGFEVSASDLPPESPEPPPPAPGGTLSMAGPADAVDASLAFPGLLEEAEAIHLANGGKLRGWSKIRKAWLAHFEQDPQATWAALRLKVDTPGADLTPDTPIPAQAPPADAPQAEEAPREEPTTAQPATPSGDFGPPLSTPPVQGPLPEQVLNPLAGEVPADPPIQAQDIVDALEDTAEAPAPAGQPTQEPLEPRAEGDTPKAQAPGQEDPGPAQDDPEDYFRGIRADGSLLDFGNTPIFELNAAFEEELLQPILSLAGAGYDKAGLEAAWRGAWEAHRARTWVAAQMVLKDESLPLEPPAPLPALPITFTPQLQPSGL